MSERKKKSWLAAVVIGGMATLLLYLFSLTGLYRMFAYAALDFKYHLCHRPGLADKNIVIVAIDEVSIKTFSEQYNISWPWPRQFYGIVLDYFRKAGAGTVVFDMTFSESEVGRLDVDGRVSERDFSDAIKRYGNVVLGEVATEAEGALPPFGNELVFEHSRDMPLKNYGSLIGPLEVFRHHRGGTGVVNFQIDADGVCRRMPLIFKVNGRYYPQLAFAAYLKAAGDSPVRYDRKRGALVTRKGAFRLDSKGFFQIYWHGKGGGGQGAAYRYDSFYDVLRSATMLMSGEKPVIPLEEYKDRHIVICASAAGLSDLKTTPFTSLAPYPGGEIQATMFDNLLNGKSITRIPFLGVVLVTFLCSMALSYAFIALSFPLALTIALSMAASAVCLSFFMFRSYAVDMAYLFPVMGTVLTSTAASMYRMLTEGAAKRQIRHIFSRYLNEDVIDLLMEDPYSIDLTGTELVGTVFFTDLQGFTTFAEDKTPQELIQVLNRYFQVITNIVLDYGGMLDKYTGDGIMAVFGAPLEREDHARAACETILAFREKKINELISTHAGNILTRIGISSGPIVVGNLGSERRMDFTAIGDTVNLSARLEGVNKAYGTTNILSEFTWEFVKNDYCFRELDYIRVKGKKRPIRVFTLIDRIDAVSGRALEVEALFREAVNTYRKREWGDAIARFERVLELAPQDAPSIAYIERCKLLKIHPELVDEHGVFTFKTK